MKDDYAFPRVTKLGEQAPGMELRDWFAGMAMQGYFAAQENWSYPLDIARVAYEYADAMLAARSAEA